jgi:uncharacterized protein
MPKKIVKWTTSLIIILCLGIILAGVIISGSSVRQGIQGQTLKQEQLVIVNAQQQKHTFRIDIAQTVEQLQKGLMYREHIDADYGMLFVYTRVQETAMWMKNTPIPLDMLFIDNDGKILWIAENAKPYDERAISSHFPIRATLELKGGEVARRGIMRGDTVYNSYFGNIGK